MNYFMKIKSDGLSDDMRRSGAVVELNAFSHRMAFISNEMSYRGFFSNNNFTQISSGKDQLPLLTWPFLDFMKSISFKLPRLIELGSGNSTLWFANIFEHVISYETNGEWFLQVQKRAPANCGVNLVSEEELLACNLTFEPTDWLLVDFAGRRSQFIKNMLSIERRVLPAVVVLDNADWYRNGADLLRKIGFIEIPFFGFKSGQTHLSCTSIFFSNIESFRPADNVFISPHFCRVSIENAWDKIDD